MTVISFDENSVTRRRRVHWPVDSMDCFDFYYFSSHEIYHSEVTGVDNKFHIRVVNSITNKIVGKAYHGMSQSYRYDNRYTSSIIMEIRRKHWVLIKVSGIFAMNDAANTHSTVLILLNTRDGTLVDLRQCNKEDENYFTIDFSNEQEPFIGYFQINVADNMNNLLMTSI